MFRVSFREVSFGYDSDMLRVRARQDSDSIWLYVGHDLVMLGMDLQCFDHDSRKIRA